MVRSKGPTTKVLPSQPNGIALLLNGGNGMGQVHFSRPKWRGIKPRRKFGYPFCRISIDIFTKSRDALISGQWINFAYNYVFIRVGESSCVK